jgi:hypothetical protein
MKNLMLAAVILALPSALPAQPNRRFYSAPARSNFRSLPAATRSARTNRFLPASRASFSPLVRSSAQSFAKKSGPKGPQPPTQNQAPIPPYDYTPGALIRSAGPGYTIAPSNDARSSDNAPGYAITQDPSPAMILNPFPGVFVGPADKLPPPNPTAGGTASGRNAITPTTPAGQGN